MEAAVAERQAVASRAYLWIWGAALVVLGAGSLLLNPSFATGQDARAEHLFGVFETNGWHGLAGLSAGIVALVFAPSRRWAPAAAIGVGVLGGIVPALVFLASGDGSVALGMIPVDFADAISLHLVPGIVGVACAFVDRRA